ncbi:hypothetical protein EVAR_20239_1 [Eumeta japonica]|uniref:Uncharacterized protein n=1 Tax=Eumeta variegata TaxID=151549 RepID=A0A4C1WAS3_EUMVA|nr:hypothetical protein EVAR_20239_1 [Eumeta japonica]
MAADESKAPGRGPFHKIGSGVHDEQRGGGVGVRDAQLRLHSVPGGVATNPCAVNGDGCHRRRGRCGRRGGPAPRCASGVGVRAAAGAFGPNRPVERRPTIGRRFLLQAYFIYQSELENQTNTIDMKDLLYSYAVRSSE